MSDNTRPGRRAALAGLAGAGIGALAAPRVARADAPRRWRMATSWPRNLPGPGVSARRLAERIAAMSDGRLVVDLFGAGELVPAFAVLDAVQNGVAEMGHTASFFWEGKAPGAALFTTAPFGPGPTEHLAWVLFGGGQALWDRLYAPFGVRAFLAGNTGPSMGGWFRQEVRSAADLKGLRIRVQGLGGDVYLELGATPQAIPPGDVYPALERGVIDAVELLSPANDLPLGLHKVAPIYYMPGFNKPNGAAEALVSLKAWEALPADLRAIVETACMAEHEAGLADAERGNAEALGELLAQGARPTPFTPDVLAAARKAADAVIDRMAGKTPLAGEIVASWRQSTAKGRAWGRVQGYMAQAIRGG
ncbi:TRAP transporter substrate-binding protein [Alsobacter sp. SYSU M60028]|uniref:TRAP transporter substrate-binding protein n=1 Tax=Alsobacter ponti TaxID=2962936 RepID=A0ABT1L8Y1_9HYPH|nr:TRAP transporter substrate-binding protein [Alsobacter ponti]MCP8937960.1 TRAP transporter substrate-binding protein [Alsobacter ponti]